MTQDRTHADQLTQALNERREKLNYFVVTASIAVIAFTLNTALDNRTLFPAWRLFLVAAGCVVLLGVAGASLWTVRTRHGQEWKYINLAAYGGDVAAANKEMDSTLNRMKQAAFWTYFAFVGGIGLLAAAYIWAIASDP